MMRFTAMERFEIRLSGLGGQGVITLGRILGEALALGHGFAVTQTQSYGPEARGGASRTDLVISRAAISYPKAESVDLLVALSQEACNTYYRNLKPRGVLVIEEDLVRQPPSNMYLALPFTRLARDRVGVPQAMNTVVLGALTWLLPFARQAVMKRTLCAALPAKVQEKNLKAFALGYAQARKHFGPPPAIWEGLGDGDEDPGD